MLPISVLCVNRYLVKLTMNYVVPVALAVCSFMPQAHADDWKSHRYDKGLHVEYRRVDERPSSYYSDGEYGYFQDSRDSRHEWENEHRDREDDRNDYSGYRGRYGHHYDRPIVVYPLTTLYQVGDILPRRARCQEPHPNIVSELPPVRVGTQYVQVQDNIYLISMASRRILDAAILLSSMR